MFTVVPNTRNSNLYLIGGLAIMIAALLTVASVHPLSHASVSSAKPASSMGGPAFFEYRRGEWSPFVGNSGIGSPAFYEYRRGEWTPNIASSSIGSAAFHEYRQGEWSITLHPNRELSNSQFRQGERSASRSPDLRDYSNYLYRQGEWFGN